MIESRNPFMRNHRAIKIAIGIVLLSGLLSTRTLQAAEETVVSFDETRTFAPVWPGGIFSQGSADGLSWLQVVSDGKQGASFISNVRPLRPELDTTGRFVKVWFRVDDLERLGGMEFRLSSDRFEKNYFSFSFPRYQDSDFNIVRGGEWTTMTFGFGEAKVVGEPDRKKINAVGWYVSDHGGDKKLTAQWGGLALVDAPREGVLTITFDDGYDEHILAAELMQPYGFRGTAYIIPEAIGAVGYMNLHQMIELRERYGWDVESHHQTAFTELSASHLESTILGIQRFINQHHVSRGGHHLAYPLGKQDSLKVRPLVRKHFATARVAGGGVETLPPADPHLLRVFNVTKDVTPARVAEAARSARAHGEWLILMFHYLVAQPEKEIDYGIEQFETLLAAVAETGINVLPLTEVFAACGRPEIVGVRVGGCELPHGLAAPSP